MSSPARPHAVAALPWPPRSRLLRFAPLAAAGALIAWGATLQAGAAGGVLAVSAVGFGAGAVAYGRRAGVHDRAWIARAGDAALLAVPGVLLVFLAFSGGGFFPDSVALAALALAVLLAVRCSLAAAPVAALRGRALVPIAALAAFAVWALLSGQWSHAPSRALVEFDRALLYLLALVLFASLAKGAPRLAVAVRVVAGAIVFVAALSLLSRVAPDVLHTDPATMTNRLSYPVSYWNALGLLCIVGAVFCLHLSASLRERRAVRVLAAGAVPLLGATLLLTYSRGAAAVGVLAVVVYALAGRPRALVPALAAAAPFTFLTMISAYRAPLLSGGNPTTHAAVAQGHTLAWIVAVAVTGAMLVRAAHVLLVDADLAAVRPLRRVRRRPLIAAGCAVAVLVAIAAHVPATAAHRWDQFVHQPTAGTSGDVRSRLSSGSSNGRLDEWRAALDGYRAHPLDGTGAGTYLELWERNRHTTDPVTDAHSLYVEVLGELGIPGLALVLVVVGGLLAALAPLRRGRDRSLYAAVFAAGLAWAVHAGIDWDWEMPAVTLWLFALGGLALGSAPRAGRRRTPGARPALAASVGFAALAVAVVPALVLASETRLNTAFAALTAGDCRSATAAAERSAHALSSRPEPFEIEGVCAARAGSYNDARALFGQALQRDPDNWATHAWFAAAQAATGRNPWPQIRRAAARNPRDPAVENLRETFAPDRRNQWVRAGRRYLREKVMPQR